MRKTAKHLYGESERGAERWGEVGVGFGGDTLCSFELFLQLLEVAEGQVTLSHTNARECMPLCAIKIITLGITELYSSLTFIFHPHHIHHCWIKYSIPHIFFLKRHFNENSNSCSLEPVYICFNCHLMYICTVKLNIVLSK